MSEKKVAYKLKPEKKIGIIQKQKMKSEAKKVNKQRLKEVRNQKALEEKRIAQKETEALEAKKTKEKLEADKLKENQKIASELAKQRKKKDKIILKEAKAHQKELEKAYKMETRERNQIIQEADNDEAQKMKQREAVRKKQRERTYAEQKTKAVLTANQDKERQEYLRVTEYERDNIRRMQDIEFKRYRQQQEEQRKAEKEQERLRRKGAGITPWIEFKEKVRRFVTFYSFENLQETINAYGYSYSFKEFALQAGAIIIAVLGISWFSELRGNFLLIMVVLAVATIPFMLYAYFKQLYGVQRFEMVQSYLSNILPIFMQKPKYRYALEEVADMSNGLMNKVILHSLEYIDTNTDDENVTRTAMEFIETEFPNSRIASTHKLMLDIEQGNSENYTDICENMYIDIEAWIRRVYNFQKELKSRRTSLIMLCAMSIVLNTMFVYMYGTSEIFDGFTTSIMYQTTTFIFLAATFLTAILIITMLHGAWLVDDNTKKNEDYNNDCYNYIHTHDGKPTKKAYMNAGFAAFAAVAATIVTKNKICLAILLLSFVALMQDKMKYNSKKNTIKHILTIEFPVWLRGVALDLNDMTVIVAMEKSMSNCSYVMKCELEKFFEQYAENPTSIKAFNNFLGEYQLEDVQSSMKVLYTIQSMSKEETQKQVTVIIQRNQELLAKSEQLQNEDSLGMAEMLGYAPMVLLTAQLIMSMVLMFIHIMAYMNEVTSTI